jgi:hypothetical protein
MRLVSLKAPVSGSIIDLQVAPGAFLNDATAAVTTIAKPASAVVVRGGIVFND